MEILRDEDSLLGSFSVLFYQNVLGMIVLINFHLFPPTPSTAVHLFTISLKNQAKLTRKIAGSYSRGFTVLMELFLSDPPFSTTPPEGKK